MTLLGRPEKEVRLMPMGHLMDQIAVYQIYHGMAEPKRDHTIDEIMPADVS